MSRIAFSRTGVTSPFGKLDAWLERTRIEGVVKEEFEKKAAAVGKPAGEFLRDIVRVVAMGSDQVKRVHGEHIDVVVRMIGGKTDGGVQEKQ